jgi:hypothetical protein
VSDDERLRWQDRRENEEGGRKLTTSSSERLGERSHQDVNVDWVDAKVVANSSSVGSKSSNRVSLVDVEVELKGHDRIISFPTPAYRQDEERAWKKTHLVLLLELDQLRQIDQRSLHRVETLDGDHDLLPRSMRPRLTLTDDLPQQRLQILHVVVLELPHARSAHPDSEPDRRVVQLVRNDEASLAYERRDGRRVCSEPHRDDERVVFAQEPRDESLRLDVKVERAGIETGSGGGNTVTLNAFLYGVGAASGSLGKAEVVVGGDIEGSGLATGVVEGVIGVGRGSVEGDDCATGDAGDGFGEAVVESGLEPTGVERVEV